MTRNADEKKKREKRIGKLQESNAKNEELLRLRRNLIQNENMLAMDTSIFRLYQKGIIDKKTALANASNQEMMSKKIGAI